MARHRPSYSGFFSSGREPQERPLERVVGRDGTSLASPELLAFAPGPSVGSGREFVPKHPDTQDTRPKPKRRKEKRRQGTPRAFGHTSDRRARSSAAEAEKLGHPREDEDREGPQQTNLWELPEPEPRQRPESVPEASRAKTPRDPDSRRKPKQDKEKRCQGLSARSGRPPGRAKPEGSLLPPSYQPATSPVLQHRLQQGPQMPFSARQYSRHGICTRPPHPGQRTGSPRGGVNPSSSRGRRVGSQTRFPWAMALTVPRLTPIRRAMPRCERRPSPNSRRISSTTVVAIIVQFSPEIAVLRLWLQCLFV